MKIEKPTKTEVCIVVGIIVMIVLTFIPSMFLYDTLMGAEGLKNIILAIIIKTVFGIVGVTPIVIYGIHLIKIIDFRESKLVFFGTIFLAVVIPLILFGGFTRSRLNEQHYIKNEHGAFADFNIFCQCISDLITDDYEEFIVNNCYVDYSKHISSSGRGGTSYHNEYTASFYNGKSKVAEAQVGTDEYDYLKNLPYGFDTKITVYKKSGFLRSIEPTVDFTRAESYEHFFTISVDGDQIVYEKNVDIKFKNIQWSGFKTGRSYDIHNSLFGIAISEERPSLDADYIGLLCNEVCLYGTVDGQYRRLSNILTENDIS